MATANALKESRLTICRNSPPRSPSRRLASAATRAVAKPPFKSRLLATIDAEIPKWLAGPLVPNVAQLVSVSKTAECAPNQPRLLLKAQRDYRLSSSSKETINPSSKGKATTLLSAVPLHRTKSDIENNPDVASLEEVGPNAISPSRERGELPFYSYKHYHPAPAVVYTRHEEEANDLAHCLKGPLGFDLEWVVTFRRGKSPREKRTAVVQLSDTRMILVVQVSAMKKFPQKVKELIEDKGIVKMGANIRNDGQKLFRDFGILASNLVELGALARQADPTFALTYKRSIVALLKVVERYTSKTLDKGKARTSDWEANLSQAQITYAANDAHCALMVYNALMTLAADNKREINLDECAADLAREYRQKATGPVVGLSPTVSSQLDSTSKGATDAVAISTTFESEPPWITPISLDGGSSSASSDAVQSARNRFARPLSLVGGCHPQSQNLSRSQEQRPAPGDPPRPQHLRAYNLWYKYDMALHDICVNLRSKDNPLAESTVISYVVRALQADPTLPYSMDRLKAFVQLEAGSWARHRDWILEMDGYKKA